MAKTTIAQLEALVLEQHAHIAQLAGTVLELTQGVAALNQRLNNAAQVIKDLRAQVDARRPSTRVQATPQPNPWFVAINQIRTERGLAPGAWVDRSEVLARMERNAQDAAIEE